VLGYQKSVDTVTFQSPKRPTSGLWDSIPSTATKRRRLSRPEVGPSTGRLGEEIVHGDGLNFAFFPVPEPEGESRPIHDTEGNALFRQHVMVQLAQHQTQKRALRSWGEPNNQVMYSLLSRASQPITLSDDREREVYFVTGEEANSLLESGIALTGPIITEDQQHFKWDQRKDRPIE
jgi:hypothetical protein